MQHKKPSVKTRLSNRSLRPTDFRNRPEQKCFKWIGGLIVWSVTSCFPGSHPERIAGGQPIQQRTRKRLESGSAQHLRECRGREIVAVRGNVEPAPIHAHDAAIPTGVIGGFDESDAARLKYTIGGPQTLDRLPLMFDVTKLRHHVEKAFWQFARSHLRDRPLQDPAGRQALPRHGRKPWAQFDSRHIEIFRSSRKKAGIPAAEVYELSSLFPAARLLQEARIGFRTQPTRIT